MALLDTPLSAPAVQPPRLGIPTRVAGFWTADGLRLDLLDDHGLSLKTIKSPGLRLAGAPPPLAAILADWDRHHGVLPLTLSGPVAGLAGWPKAAPTPCPVHIDTIPATVLHVADQQRPVSLVPGLACSSRMGCRDHLWGEETMLAGAAILYPDLLRGAKTVCIPGPRTRWIMLRHGHILHFTTSLAGELCQRMTGDRLPDGAFAGMQPGAFARGMKEATDYADIDLLHLLHHAQCRSLEGEIAAADMPSFMLGLLVRRDVAATDALLKLGKRSSLVLIADKMQGDLYGKAFEAQGLCPTLVGRSRAAALGLARIALAAQGLSVAVKSDMADRERT